MKALISILMLSLSTGVLAVAAPKENSGKEDPVYEIAVDPNVYSLKKFQRKGTRVVPLLRAPSPEEIPDREAREARFAKVKELSQHTQGLDELNRDRLYVLTKNRPIEEVKKSFPAIPEKVLRALKAELKKP